jgi:hypothetical protein
VEYLVEESKEDEEVERTDEKAFWIQAGMSYTISVVL